MMPIVVPAKSIPPFRVMAILARARELEARGRPIIHMEIGEPDFATPEPIVAAGIRALKTGDMHYTQAAGIPELRESIAQFYDDCYGLQISPSRIIITPGATGALLLVLAALVRAGDHVLVTDPGYPCQRHIVEVMGGVAIPIPLDAPYQLSENLLAHWWDDRTQALVLASPANPTGALIADETLNRVVNSVTERGGALIVDEIYHGLTYERSAQSALAFSDDVFVINSFSKYFNMTGFRLGWLVVPQPYVNELEQIAQNLFLACSTIAQRAALAAFLPETTAILEARREEFKTRRDLLLPRLTEIGFEVAAPPEGAFYIYAGCGKFTADSAAFCEELLQEAGVALTPGVDFGGHRGREHVRFAYTVKSIQLLDGASRIADFLSASRRGR